MNLPGRDKETVKLWARRVWTLELSLVRRALLLPLCVIANSRAPGLIHAWTFIDRVPAVPFSLYIPIVPSLSPRTGYPVVNLYYYTHAKPFGVYLLVAGGVGVVSKVRSFLDRFICLLFLASAETRATRASLAILSGQVSSADCSWGVSRRSLAW